MGKGVAYNINKESGYCNIANENNSIDDLTNILDNIRNGWVVVVAQWQSACALYKRSWVRFPVATKYF